MKRFKFFTEEDNPRIPRKKGQPAGSDKHSDLYTDENPKGTIHGLGFKDVETAKKSVSKIEGSGKSHAHKIQAAIAMEQRARVMGKKAEADVYRAYINKMKKKTKEMQNESSDWKKNIEMRIPLKGYLNTSRETFLRVAKKAGLNAKLVGTGAKQVLHYNGSKDKIDRMMKELEKELKKINEGLWDNIRKKRERIKRGSGERMRKKGEKGAPTQDQIDRAKSEEYMEYHPKNNAKYRKLTPNQ